MLYCLETIFKLLGTSYKLLDSPSPWTVGVFCFSQVLHLLSLRRCVIFLKKSWEIMHPKTYKIHWGVVIFQDGFPTKKLSKSNHQWLQRRVITPSLLIWWVDLAGKTITCTKHTVDSSCSQEIRQGIREKLSFFYGSLTPRFFCNLEKTLGYPESGNSGNSPISQPVCHFWVHDFPFLIPLGGICDRSL